MGREIRRVPPDWQHPKHERCPHWPKCSSLLCYRPLYDQEYHEAAREWMEGYAKFTPNKYARYYWEDSSPPDDQRYRDRAWTPEEATHLQIYETVSEGTPVTPHFATEQELVDYLVEHGDFWDQTRALERPGFKAGWDRESAEAFVRRGHAVSLVTKGGNVYEPRDGKC